MKKVTVFMKGGQLQLTATVVDVVIVKPENFAEPGAKTDIRFLNQKNDTEAHAFDVYDNVVAEFFDVSGYFVEEVDGE